MERARLFHWRFSRWPRDRILVGIERWTPTRHHLAREFVTIETEHDGGAVVGHRAGILDDHVIIPCRVYVDVPRHRVVQFRPVDEIRTVRRARAVPDAAMWHAIPRGQGSQRELDIANRIRTPIIAIPLCFAFAGV